MMIISTQATAVYTPRNRGRTQFNLSKIQSQSTRTTKKPGFKSNKAETCNSVGIIPQQGHVCPIFNTHNHLTSIVCSKSVCIRCNIIFRDKYFLNTGTRRALRSRCTSITLVAFIALITFCSGSSCGTISTFERCKPLSFGSFEAVIDGYFIGRFTVFSVLTC